MFDVLIVGCGLCGMVAARELAERGKKVHIIEKRNHVGGNIYDFYDENGILIQKYGPHVFFTDNAEIEKYITKFSEVEPFYAECRTFIDGKYIPMPFNFSSIDMIYEDAQYADDLKRDMEQEFGENSIVSVLDVIDSDKEKIHKYGMYMFEHEYRKYSAKQWGREIEEINPEVFMRVPVYVSYKKEYMSQKYQYMPCGGFTELAKKILRHEKISVETGQDALHVLEVDYDKKCFLYKGEPLKKPLIYTGPLDRLFQYKHGKLPYRSLEFTYKTILKKDTLSTPLTAFPEGDKYIRITDYTNFPPQDFEEKALVAIEFPVEYREDELCGNEPYYPTLTKESEEMYKCYEALAVQFEKFYPCGRLADFKYYNMDTVIEMAQNVARGIIF